MKVYKHRGFRQWAKSEKLADSVLSNAIREMEKGLYEASLGGGLFKKRIAKNGKGKSGGYRTLLAFKNNSRAVFVYGFSKNEQDNISSKEMQAYKLLAKALLTATDDQLEAMIKNGKLYEVKHDQKEKIEKRKKA